MDINDFSQEKEIRQNFDSGKQEIEATPITTKDSTQKNINESIEEMEKYIEEIKKQKESADKRYDQKISKLKIRLEKLKTKNRRRVDKRILNSFYELFNQIQGRDLLSEEDFEKFIVFTKTAQGNGAIYINKEPNSEG